MKAKPQQTPLQRFLQDCTMAMSRGEIPTTPVPRTRTPSPDESLSTETLGRSTLERMVFDGIKVKPSWRRMVNRRLEQICKDEQLWVLVKIFGVSSKLNIQAETFLLLNTSDWTDFKALYINVQADEIFQEISNPDQLAVFAEVLQAFQQINS